MIAAMRTDETAVGQQLDALGRCEAVPRGAGLVDLPIHVEMEPSARSIVAPKGGPPLRVPAPAHRWILDGSIPPPMCPIERRARGDLGIDFSRG